MSDLPDGVTATVALILAVAAAAAVDRMAARRGFDPPGFRDPGRRLGAGLGLTFIFYLGIFYPASTVGQAREVSFEAVSAAQLFFFHFLLMAWLGAWCVLGFGTGSRFDPGGDGGVVRGRPPVWVRQLGLRARRILPELSVGLSAGLLGWLAVLSAALLLGLLVAAMGGEEALTREPSEQIVWLATLPVGLRLAVSLVAGVVEELFFRGFLQPRVGIAASSLLFAGAHVAYGEPFLLFGVLLLSLFYAWLTRWRGSVYAAMAAHFLFDAIQLLVVIPAVLRIIATGSAFGT